MHRKIIAGIVGLIAAAGIVVAGAGTASAEPLGPWAPVASSGASAGGNGAPYIAPIGRVYSSHVRTGVTSAHGRSLYRIERDHGYSPAQARYRAQVVINRVYPAWNRHVPRSYSRAMYVPRYGSVFYGR